MSREIRFSVDDDDYPILVAYAKLKGFRTVSNMARRGAFALMERNPVGRHDKSRGADRTEPSGGVSREATDADA